MTAHSIVCRLGDRDRTRLQPAGALIRTEISFIDADRRLAVSYTHLTLPTKA